MGLLGVAWSAALFGVQQNQGTISARDLLTKLRNQEPMLLLDVRQPAEWVSEMQPLPGAKNIPLSDLPKRYAEIPKGTTVVLICRTGHRSSQAQAFLKGKGYTQTLNLAGGMRVVKELSAK